MKLAARLAVLTSLVAVGPAFAAVTPFVESAKAPRADQLQLAQIRDAEMYIDQQGNQVLVDSATGEIISVRPPQDREPRDFSREERRREREARRQRDWADDGYDQPRRDRRYRDNTEYSARQPQDDYYPDENQPRRQQDWRQPESDFPATPRVAAPKPQKPTKPNAPVHAPAAEPEMAVNEPASTTAAPALEPEQMSTGSVTRPTTTTKPASMPPAMGAATEAVAGLQVLLDRFGASPGVIDGRFGSNVDKAIVNYNAIHGQNLKSTDTALIQELLESSGGPALVDYTITPEDAAGPYVASIPEDYAEKAKLERMAFTSVTEALAERFHMDENYLKKINPEADFNNPGTMIRVANIGKPATTHVVKVIADKPNRQVRGYGADGRLVVAYPSSIGSADTPSPSGTHLVSRVAINPGYTYNPKINFKQGTNDKILTLPPGPNGPVGSIWIALDKPTYGVHGTPEPSKIGRGESHGCVRLTNWDATELAKLVKAGVPVEFIE